MVGNNPALHQLEEILCFRDNLLSLGTGRDGSVVIVDYISLAPARLEKVERGVRSSPKRQTGDLKGQAMMTRVVASRNPAQAMDMVAVCKAAL